MIIVSIQLLSFNAPFAKTDNYYANQNNYISIKISLSTGYRVDNLDWSISAEQGLYHIRFELDYNDIEIWHSTFQSAFIIKDSYLHLSYSEGTIFNGKGFDSDYQLNGKNVLTHKSKFEINDDNVKDLIFGVRYQFEYLNNNLSLIPLLGLFKHEQNLHMTKGKWIYPCSDKIEWLDSTYETEWKGWWLGIKTSYNITTNWVTYASIKYNRSEYEAEANWNLREDFAHPTSFEHEAYGYGYDVNVGIFYNIYKKLNIGLNYLWRDWIAEDGIDRLYLQSGEKIESELDEVNWESQSLHVKFNYQF